jgi:hypothetical protein
MENGKLYSREDMINAFKLAQHADFSPTQIARMVDQADANGQSRDYGDGYMIYRIGQNLYRGTVAGKPVTFDLSTWTN